MQTFEQHFNENWRARAMTAAASMIPGVANADFATDWGKHYQTSNDPKKIERARSVMDAEINIPADAKQAIETAVYIFQGDEGKSAELIRDYLTKTGKVESHYKHVRQVGGGPARSYWQVEPATAMSLVKHSYKLFGPKFEKQFGPNALKTVQSWDERKWSVALEKLPKLGATMAAATWIASKWRD